MGPRLRFLSSGDWIINPSSSAWPLGQTGDLLALTPTPPHAPCTPGVPQPLSLCLPRPQLRLTSQMAFGLITLPGRHRPCPRSLSCAVQVGLPSTCRCRAPGWSLQGVADRGAERGREPRAAEAHRTAAGARQGSDFLDSAVSHVGRGPESRRPQGSDRPLGE